MTSCTIRKAARCGIKFLHSVPALSGMTLALCFSGISPLHAAPTGSVCLNLADIDHTEILDDQTVLFFMHDDAVWENLMPEPCAGLKAKNGFEYSGHEPKICGNIDLIHPLNSDASCALGEFELYAGGAQ